MPICTVLTGSEWQDRPRPLDSRRPVPPAFEEVDLGRRPGREDPRPEGGAASTRALGSKKTWRLPGSRQEGPRVARCTAGAAHAGAGTDRRRAGPDGAHHRVRQGEPGPRSARARRDSRRRPVRTGAGWSTSPTCRPGTGFLVAPPSSRGLCATAASSAGPPARARGAGARPAPWNRRPGARKHRDGGDPWGLVHHSDHGSQYLSIAYTGRLVDEGIEASAGAVGSSLRRRRRPGPGQAPCKRGARSGATAPGRAATTSKPQPPAG